jgi:hypothetical protein
MRPLAVSLLLALPAFAAPNASLDKAQKLYADLNYTEAAKSLDAALKQPGNDRASLLKILELQAVVQATLGQSEKAAKGFQTLLTLSPDFKLEGNYPPRVTTAFYEARGWAEANGHVEAKALDAAVEPGKVKQVRLELSKDPLKLVKKVRFHLGAQDVVAPVTGNLAAASPREASLELSWWAELLGDKDAVLLEVGSAASPKVERAPAKPGVDAPVVAAAAPVPAAVEPEPEPEVVAAPVRRSEPPNVKRLASYGLVGGAAICAGVGLAFGVMANGTKAQVDGAPVNAMGHVSSMTQVQALELDGRQRSQATLANVFTGAAVALAATGVTLFVLSLGGDSRAQLVPSAAGAAIVGTFP